MLKHPEGSMENFDKYKIIYSIVDKVKKIFLCRKLQEINLKEIIEIKQMLCNEDNFEVVYNEKKYKPDFWLGVYEKR